MADFTRGFTKLAVRMGWAGMVIDQADQPTWHFDFEVGPVWEEVDATYNWWMTLDPLVSASDIEYLNRAIKAHDVYFITARHTTKGFSAEKQTELWLQSIGVDSHHAKVISTKKKGAVCAALGITDFLDDNVPQLEDLRAHGITAWCRHWLYNDGEELPCGNVADFLFASGAMA